MIAKQFKINAGESEAKVFPYLGKEFFGTLIADEELVPLWWEDLRCGLDFNKTVPSAIVGAVTKRWPVHPRSQVGFIPCDFHFDDGKIVIEKAKNDHFWSIAVIANRPDLVRYAQIRGITAVKIGEEAYIAFMSVEHLDEANMPCYGLSKSQIQKDIQRMFS